MHTAKDGVVSAFGKKSKILFKTHTVVKDERITAEK
jgi:hypothetical protein